MLDQEGGRDDPGAAARAVTRGVAGRSRTDIEGSTVGALQRAGAARIVAIRTGRGAQVLWLPPDGRKLTRTDRILTVSNREGLGDLLRRAAPALDHDATSS